MLYDDDTGGLVRPKAARRAAGPYSVSLPKQSSFWPSYVIILRCAITSLRRSTPGDTTVWGRAHCHVEQSDHKQRTRWQSTCALLPISLLIAAPVLLCMGARIMLHEGQSVITVTDEQYILQTVRNSSPFVVDLICFQGKEGQRKAIGALVQSFQFPSPSHNLCCIVR